jgi:nicotinamidase-related amidase
VTPFDREARGRRIRLSPKLGALLVIDIQDKLAGAMPAEVMDRVIHNTRILIQAAARFHMPILVSEQYPRGLGRVVPPLEDALGAAVAAGAQVHRWEKLEFSAVAAEGFVKHPNIPRGDVRPALDQWIVCGMETHVCVYQTVRDITGWGATVHIASDAVCSRLKANWRTGLELARDCGAVITATEVVAFDLLGKAGSDDFKALAKAIK